MNSKYYWLTIGSGIFFAFNVLSPVLQGQSTHTHLLVQEIIGEEAIEIVKFPETFNFAPVKVSGEEQYRFHSTLNADTDTALVVSDKRNKGGFKLYLTIEDEAIEAEYKIENEGTGDRVKLAKKKYIGNENLYVATSAAGEKVADGIAYSENFQGPGNVQAPLDVTGRDLTDFATYEEFGQSLVVTPIVLMDGTLPTTSGRDGEMSIDVNFALKIKKYQPPGDYKMNFVYTIVPN